MSNAMFIAQKAIILNRSNNKILVQKYVDGKFTREKVRGKYGLPGGKMDFGETPEETLIREVKEETGVTVKPIKIFQTYTWTYQRNEDNIQIVATAWIAKFVKGKLINPPEEKETTLEKARWVNIKEIKIEDFIEDEKQAIGNFLKTCL
ncbi:NUDIX hydrolase [Candidatus Woesebacteria bacterium]|nr:MAG: NUDIX hydrolase [Candidatus Woesebacteria bacterium]